MSWVRPQSTWRAFGSLRGRLGRSIGAQVYSQIVTLVIQLASIPLLVAAWGLETYGVWLLLMALPAYLALSDLGLTFVAKNTMAMQVASGNRSGAIETFQSILALLCVIVSGVAVAALLAVWLVPFDRIFALATVPLETARTALTAQLTSALLYQIFLLFCAGLRADGRPAMETIFSATARLLEAAAICAAALLGADIALAAIAGLATRIASFSALYIHLRSTVAWLPIGIGRAQFSRMREMLGPSLSYMLVPLANALMLQGPVVILGIVAGPTTVALYSITRTVTRLGMALANTLNFAFAPEYSFASGRRDAASRKQMLFLHGLLTGGAVLAYAVVMVTLSDGAVRLLSHGAVSPLPWLTLVLSLAVVLEMAWSYRFTGVAASNEHKLAAFAYALASVFCLGLAVLRPELATLSIAQVAVHLIMIAVVGTTFPGRQRVAHAGERSS